MKIEIVFSRKRKDDFRKKMKRPSKEVFMKKGLRVVLVGLALTAMVGTALAAGPGFGMRQNVNCPGWGDRLNLGQEQKGKLYDLRAKHLKETGSLRNELRVKWLELRALWAAPNPDRDKIQAKQKEINALRDQLQAKATDFRLEARKVLTPEQAAQLETYGPGMGFRGKGRHYRMGGLGPCGGFGQGPGRGFGSGGPGI